MVELITISLHSSPLYPAGVGDAGGMNVYVKELASAVSRSGSNCHVFTRASNKDELGSILIEPGFWVHGIKAGPLDAVEKEDLWQYSDEFRQNAQIQIENLINKGSVFDAIHANYWLSGVVGHRLKHELNIPLLCTFHTLYRVKAQVSDKEILTGEPETRSMVEKDLINCSDLIIANCEVECRQIIELYDADPNRVKVISPGIDPAFFCPGNQDQAKAAIGFKNKGPLLLFAGRIQPLKDLETAIYTLEAVLRHFKGAELLVLGGPSGAGGGQYLGRCKELANSLNISNRVHFLNAVSHESVSTYLRAADLCLIPSKSESFGLIALEAQACGLPVVAFKVGGLNALVEDKVTGMLVEPGERAGFIKAALYVLSNKEIKRALAKNGIKNALGYSWENAALKLISLTESLEPSSLVTC
jgi:D-inositol-3-phosphate glycosyltransferase